MENADFQRIRKIVNWLIFKLDLENGKELASKLGYNYSYFTQFCTGATPITEKFIEALCSMDRNLNKTWILTGGGSMFKNTSNGCENCKKLESIIKDLQYTIDLQRELINNQKKLSV